MTRLADRLKARLAELEKNQVRKRERVLTTPQGSHIEIGGLGPMINFCTNNYLGLANDPAVIKLAQAAFKKYGYGIASVRFIAGTHEIGLKLEKRLAGFLEQEAVMTYTTCFDANAGLFEALLSAEDAIISDALNHASIIDGVRLCKAQRFVYKHNDLTELELRLQEAKSAPVRLIATDGVFSMNGDLAPLDKICALAQKYDALVMVDDSHAVGVVGPQGRGTPALFKVVNKIDLLSGTFSKALGGGVGGYVAGRQIYIDALRQFSRPYTFSNALPPALSATVLGILNIVEMADERRANLSALTGYMRQSLTKLGFTIKPGSHPIIPIMLFDGAKAQQFATKLVENGIFAVGFFYPVVPQGEARIRVQISAAHVKADLDKALAVFEVVGKELGILKPIT